MSLLPDPAPARRSRHRIAVTTAALLTTAATATAVAFAQGGAPPELAYKLAKNGGPAGPATAQPGPVTFSAKATAGKEGRTLQLFRVADGATDIAGLRKRLEAVRSGNGFEKLTALTAVGGVGGATTTTAARFTTTLTPGTYLVGDSSEDAVQTSVLTVSGEANGATARTPATTVTMQDYKFSLNRSLPRTGPVRFVNAGKRVHFVVAFKAANAPGAAKLARAFRANDERTAGQLIRGEGTGVGFVSPGQEVDVASRYGKGSYVFVCFWGSKASKDKEHNLLGMTKVIAAK